MSWQILQGNVFDTLPTIKPGSIDAVVTSPPYWKLRSYLPKGHALKKFELGSEATPAEFVANQVRVLDLVRTALAPHGTVWLNIGDTYAYDSKWGGETSGKHRSELHGKNGYYREDRGTETGQEDGALCLIPQRLMIALQDAGWVVRSVVIWSKPSPMPSSIAGWCWRRCRVKVATSSQVHQPGCGRTNYNVPGAHASKSTPQTSAKWAECPGCKKCIPNGGYVLRRGSWRPTSSWEPVIMLAKSDKYFADGEPVKQKVKASSLQRVGQNNGNPNWNGDRERQSPQSPQSLDIRKMVDPNGANLRDVWSIATEPLHEKHFAAFPVELVARCLKSSVSEKGYCRTCGAPWVRMLESEQVKRYRPNDKTARHNEGAGVKSCGNTVAGVNSRTIGWRQSCKCKDSTPRPGLVLDPFCGSGRTGIACRRLGFDFIGCELNEAYVEMANRRIEAALRQGKRSKEKKASGLFDEFSTQEE